jgi:cytoskeleton protein RodZ
MNLTIRSSAGIVGCVTEDKARPLGDWLRQRREELDVSLEQVEEDTRIRVRYLQALEAENFEALPDLVVGRGFLRNYAAYLELDPQEAANRYSKLVAAPVPEPLPIQEPSPFTSEPFHPVALHKMPGFGRRRGVLVGVVVILIAALSVLGWWAYPRLRDILIDDAPTTVPVVATTTQRVASGDLSTATQTPTKPATATSAPPTATLAQAMPTLELTITPTFTPSPSPSPSPPIYTGIFLELLFTDTSWIQVSVDGVRQFQGELEVDTYKSWYGEERVELRIGNAGAVQVTVNGEKLGALGAVGDVVDRIFEKVGEGITATTATPAVTETVTLTAEATVPPIAPPPTATPAIEPTSTISPTVAISPTESISPTVGP